jgi:hypothetical protein
MSRESQRHPPRKIKRKDLGMTASEILNEFAVRIYKPPFSNMRRNGTIADLSNPIAVLMLIVDFNTELEMSGILDTIGNSTGAYLRETSDALEIIGCKDVATKLRKIIKKAGAAGMTHEAIQHDRRNLKPYTVTSFREIHGDKWQSTSKEVSRLASDIQFDEVWKRAEMFIEEHKKVFLKALAS